MSAPFGRKLSFISILSLYLLPALVLHAIAASVNITVDDTLGNIGGPVRVTPTYSPNNDTLWHGGSPTVQCAICGIKPSELDMTQIFSQTWHDGTYFLENDAPMQVVVTFPGTAVYVYNIILNSLGGIPRTTNLSFTIDGETVGSYSHTPDATSNVRYNQLVYSTSGLSNSNHTLVMTAAGSANSLIMFDYLVYTTEVEDTPSSSTAQGDATIVPSPTATTSPASTSKSTHQETAAIVGGVIGALALLLVATGTGIACWRRRRRFSRPPETEPFMIAPTNSNALPSGKPKPIKRAMVEGSSPEYATNTSPGSTPSRAFDAQRETELVRQIATLEEEMRAVPYQGLSSEVPRASVPSPSPSAVLTLQDEIAALRAVLDDIVAMRRAAQDQPMEDLPRYEDTR